MATKTPKKNDFNRVHNPGDEHYDEEMRRHYEESGDPSQDIINKPTSRKDDPGEDALKKYQDQEDNPEDTSSRDEEDVGTQESRGDDVNFKNNVQAEPKKEKPSRFQALKKKRNIFLVSIALLAGVSGLFAFIGAPALLLVNFKEVMLNKFDDRMQSLETHRNYRVFLKKIGGTPTAGCVIKVKCRFKGMTDREIKKFERRNPNTKIVTEGRSFLGKNKIKGIQFIDDNGKQRFATASQFKRYAKSSQAFRKTFVNYNKSTVAHWRDKQAGKLFVKLKVFLGKHFSKRPPPDGSPASQAEAKAAKDAKDAKAAKIRADTQDKISKTNVIGVLCAVKEIIAASKHIAKVELAIKLIALSVLIANEADDIKAGTATGDSGTINHISELGEMLTQKDDNGETAFDSFGYQYASAGLITKNRGNQGQFQMGAQSDKGIIGQITRAGDSIPGLSELVSVGNFALSGIVCKALGSPAGTLLGCAAAIAAAVASFGLGTAAAVAACIGTQIALNKLIAIALPILLSKVVKTVTTDGIVGGDAGNASTGGFGALAANDARYHGAYPLTTPQAKKYDNFSDNAQAGGTYENLGSALDIHNPNSFAGKLAAIFVPTIASVSASASSIPTALASLPMTTIGSSFTATHARSIIPGEYSQCDDGDYQEIDVATDPFCVPQYGFDPSMMLGDNDYNSPVAAIRQDKPKSNGFSLAWLFEPQTAQAASIDDNRGFSPDNRFDADDVIAFMCGHPIDGPSSCDKWIDDDGNPIDDPGSDDDFSDYTKECLETTDPVGPDSPDMCKTKKCKTAGSNSKEFRYCMFSQYAADGTLDDQYQDNDADLSGAPAADAAPAADPAAAGAGVGAIPTGTAQELAKMIVDSGNVTGDSRYMKQITDIANGGTGCFVSPDILGFLAAMSKTHKLFISSLNRRCTGVLTASGTGSLHYAGQGGRAVDVSIFDGTSMGNSTSTSSYDSPRAKAAATAYFNEAVKILPKNAELGQINSCGLTVNTAGFSDIVTDTCNHAHVGIP